MTNNITTSTNSITSPIKVALVGLTMIQQALLEFYFATQEGSQRYSAVLGKDADAFITNFDEQGALEAWENLYPQENRPTLVLSNCRKTIDRYLYFPKPITPNLLAEAASAINDLLAVDELGFDSFFSNQTQTSSDPLFEELTTLQPLPNNEKTEKFDKINTLGNEKLDTLEELTLNKNQIDFSLSDEKTNNNSEDLFLGLELEEPPKQTKSQESLPTDSSKLSFDESLLYNSTPVPVLETIENSNKPDGKLTSADELQSLLDELNDKNSQKKEEKKEDKRLVSASTKSKEKQRWKQLCGEYDNNYYEKNQNSTLYFDLKETLLPYINDTVAFTERADCWMELSYKPLSIIINPENKLVYSNLSLENPLFVQICSKSLIEELIEYLEVDTNYIEQIKHEDLNDKLFSYDLNYFIWTVSLLISHGRLPESTNLDEPISITDWLSLNKVERFPYIMQIAAVFHQHHASLNEATSWMTLPKRYIYAFYNGVLALGMIDKNPVSNKKKLITRGNTKEENNGLLKSLLFKKTK